MSKRILMLCVILGVMGAMIFQVTDVLAQRISQPGFDMVVSQTDGGGTFYAGDTIEYVISAKNIGTTFAPQVFVSETVPAYTSVNFAASTAGWQCSPNNRSGSNCTIQIGDVEAGQEIDVIFVVDVDADLPADATGTLNHVSVFVGGSPFPETSFTNNGAKLISMLATVRDSDGDGVEDDVDNCPDLANVDQANFDGDLHGDACDPDDDNDGVADGDDVCAETSLPDDRPRKLAKNRFYANEDGEFVNRHGRVSRFTVDDTGGCSAIQIIDELGLGRGIRKHGLPRGILAKWSANH